MHTIRRSGARALYDELSQNHGNDKAIFMVSVLLDHEDTKVTLKYLDLNIERDHLNDWLREHSMYGEAPNPAGATVTTLPARASLKAVEPLPEASGGDGKGAAVQSA